MFLIRFFGWVGVGDEFLAWNRFNGILLAVMPVVNCGGIEPKGIGLSRQSRIDLYLFVCGVLVQILLHLLRRGQVHDFPILFRSGLSKQM
jgi:hypothetical protein